MFSLDVCHGLEFYREVLADTRAARIKRKETDGNRWKQNETEQLSKFLKHFSQVYKIEEVDIEHLEPLSSINLEMPKLS